MRVKIGRTWANWDRVHVEIIGEIKMRFASQVVRDLNSGHMGSAFFLQREGETAVTYYTESGEAVIQSAPVARSLGD